MSAEAPEIKDEGGPTNVIVIGMAGSGKTTLMQRLNMHVNEHKMPSYIINLDPAVGKLPYTANIDIRDTVNYKEVMKQYGLGPNGGIMTSLNLFATRFDQVLGFVEKRASELDYVFVDTPGQIEVFTWSASGTIISDSLAATHPTVVVYVIDTPRTSSPNTFMSNMMYACSIMYKSKLPFLVVFNKIDVVSHHTAVNWMNDYDAFSLALQADSSYMSSLTKSMGLVLDEFYQNLRTVGVSAFTGAGMDGFFDAIKECRKEYFETYRPTLEKQKAEAKKKKEKEAEKQISKFKKDMAKSRGQRVVVGDGGGGEEEDDEDDDDVDEEINAY